jgi:RNA polymerase sigma-70 factor (ECF subfamily)
VAEPTSTAIEQWIVRIQAGDRAAREELFKAVDQRLRELSSRMLRKYPSVQRYAETGDVYQNACLRLMKALEEVKPGSTREFYALAAVQVRRELLDLARHYKVPGRGIQPMPDASGSSSGYDPAAPDAVNTDELDRWARFHEEVEKLPADLREVVGLRFYHGWPEERIATLLNVSTRSVQRYWKEALADLKGKVDR